jgi:hypothetical protein
VRVVSWNLANRVRDAARRQGEFLADLEPAPNLVLLQEVNRHSIERVCERAGLDWCRLAVDIRQPEPGDTRVPTLGVGLAGRGPAPASVAIRADVPLPERTIHGVVDIDGQQVRVASYLAPPGVSWFLKSRNRP